MREHSLIEKLKTHYHFDEEMAAKISLQMPVSMNYCDMLMNMSDAIHQSCHFSLYESRAKSVAVILGNENSGRTSCCARLCDLAHQSNIKTTMVDYDMDVQKSIKKSSMLANNIGSQSITTVNLDSILKKIKSGMFVTIDTSQLKITKKCEADQIKKIINITSGDGIISMQAGLDVKESVDQAIRAKEIGCKYIIATKIDCFSQISNVVAASYYSQMKIIGGTNSPSIKNSLVRINGMTIANNIMNMMNVDDSIIRSKINI